LKKIYGDDETIKSLSGQRIDGAWTQSEPRRADAQPRCFDGAKEADIEEMLKLAGLDASGQSTVMTAGPVMRSIAR